MVGFRHVVHLGALQGIGLIIVAPSISVAVVVHHVEPDITSAGAAEVKGTEAGEFEAGGVEVSGAKTGEGEAVVLDASALEAPMKLMMVDIVITGTGEIVYMPDGAGNELVQLA